jgi:hypothetical protein
LQAQIAYQDAITADVRYAYRNTDWFVETVAGPGRLGDYVQLYFDAENRPLVAYSNEGTKTIYTAARNGANAWSNWKTGQAWGPMSAALNERSGETIFSFLSRARDNVFSIVAV